MRIRYGYAIMITQRVFLLLWRKDGWIVKTELLSCVHIPYRTMTEWELDNRHAPDYVLWLLEYYIRNEGLMVKGRNEGGGDSEKETT